MQDMRDFRDAKAMARTLRAALAAKGIKITIGESLELIAKAFGVADWNTLSVTIRREVVTPPNSAPGPQFRTDESGSVLSTELSSTLRRALTYANQRTHQHTTLEHLLLALIDDVDASAAMKACNVDLGGLKGNLINYIDKDLKILAIDDGESRPTAAFQRVIQRAATAVRSAGRKEMTGANVLVAIFAERESHSAYFLQEQEMTRYDAVNYISDISHGIVKGGGDTAA
jgi:Glyoxalase superfamily protein/Clp amino terminal domain, pathogenicity island component